MNKHSEPGRACASTQTPREGSMTTDNPSVEALRASVIEECAKVADSAMLTGDGCADPRTWDHGYNSACFNVRNRIRALATLSTTTPPAPVATAEVERPLDPLERLHRARELLATEYDRIGHIESAELVRRGRADECDLAAERAVFAALSPKAQDRGADFNGWYCAHCQRGVDGSEVTYREAHEVCGRIITNDVPPASPSNEERLRAEFAAERAIGQSQIDLLTERLDTLQQAEAEYRLMHDRHGDGSRAAGRAWDLMRRAGDKARAALKGEAVSAVSGDPS